MPVRAEPKERPIIRMLLLACDNGAWQNAHLDWVEEKEDGAVEVIATRGNLRAVHDVAAHLLRELAPKVDREAVLFGAATHDIGKVLNPGELSGPGSLHEAAGYQLLLARGIAEQRARFARDHSRPNDLEDQLVALADKLWKGRRDRELETRLASALQGSRTPWESFLALDEVCERLAEGGPARLAFQNQFA